LQERLVKFGLELHPEKTRLIEFGRYATERRKRRGLRRPETFDFLGFTHICGTSPTTGWFMVKRKTIGKRMAAKLKEIKAELIRRRHAPNVETLKWLQSVMRGYFQYHAIPDNWSRLGVFRNAVLRMWLRQLRRRSQRNHWTWEKLRERLGACRFKSLSTLSTRYSLEFSVSNVLVSVTRIVFGRSKLIRGTKRVLFGAPSGALVVSSRLQTTLAAE
jgi:hypothetical protein